MVLLCTLLCHWHYRSPHRQGPSRPPAGPARAVPREPLANAIGDLAKTVLPTKLELADSEIEDMDMQQTQLAQLKSPGSPKSVPGVTVPWTGPLVCEATSVHCQSAEGTSCSMAGGLFIGGYSHSGG